MSWIKEGHLRIITTQQGYRYVFNAESGVLHGSGDRILYGMPAGLKAEIMMNGGKDCIAHLLYYIFYTPSFRAIISDESGEVSRVSNFYGLYRFINENPDGRNIFLWADRLQDAGLNPIDIGGYNHFYRFVTQVTEESFAPFLEWYKDRKKEDPDRSWTYDRFLEWWTIDKIVAEVYGVAPEKKQFCDSPRIVAAVRQLVFNQVGKNYPIQYYRAMLWFFRRGLLDLATSDKNDENSLDFMVDVYNYCDKLMYWASKLGYAEIETGDFVSIYSRYRKAYFERK